MSRQPDRNAGQADKEDRTFHFLGNQHTDNRTRQGLASSALFFDTVLGRTGQPQQLCASPAREPSRRPMRDQGSAQETWKSLGTQLQPQAKRSEQHGQESTSWTNQQPDHDVSTHLAGKESQLFQIDGRVDQRQRIYAKTVNVSEPSAQHLAKHPEKPGQSNAMRVSQQVGTNMSTLQASKENQPAQLSDGAHPDNMPQALTASIYFCETETVKKGEPENPARTPVGKGSSISLQEAFVCAHEAWVSLETELRVKKNELEQAQKSLAENTSLVTSLKAEHDLLKTQLQQKKNEHLKLEAIIVGLEERSASHEKQLEVLQNKLAYFHDLQGQFNEQVWATNEDCDDFTRSLEQLRAGYDENIKRLEVQRKQLSADVVKLQKEVAVREREVEAKAKSLEELSQTCARLENQAAEASEQFQKMEQEKAKVQKNLQLLAEEHDKMLQEKDNTEEMLRETRMWNDSLVSHVEETRILLEQNVTVDDEQNGLEVYQLNRNLVAAITVRHAVEELILQCKAGRERLDQALSDIEKLQNEKEKLSEDNKGLMERTAAFEDVIAAKQGLELELSEGKLRIASLTEQLREKEELLTSGLQKACSDLQKLKEENNNIMDDLTKKFAECASDMEVLGTNLSSEMSAKAVLQRELENMRTDKGELERQVSHLVVEVEGRDKSLNQQKEEIDSLTEDVTNLRQLLETAMDEIDNLMKSSALSATSASEQIRELHAQLEHKSTCVAHLSEKLKETEKLAADLKEEVKTSSTQMDQLRSENEAHMKDIRQLSAELEEMKLRPEMVTQEVQVSQAEESDRIKALQAKLQEAEDKFNVLEIDFNRMRYEKEVRCKAYEERVRELRSELQQADSSNARLQNELIDLKGRESVHEQQKNSVTKQMQNMQTTNKIIMSELKKEHDAAVQKLEKENADLQQRLKDLTSCLEETKAQAEKQKAELEVSRDQAHEELKCLEAKLDNEVSKKEEVIDKLRRQLRLDELKHEEELLNLRKCFPLGHESHPEKQREGVKNEPFVTDSEPRSSPPASPGTRQHTTDGNVVPLTLQPIEQPVIQQAVQPVVQPTVKRTVKRAPQQAVQPLRPLQVQTRKKALLPVEVDNLFDSSNSSTDASQLTADNGGQRPATPKRRQTSAVAQKSTTDMPPPRQSPAPKRKKFFKSHPDWDFGPSRFR